MRNWYRLYLCLAIVTLPLFVLVAWLSRALSADLFCKPGEPCLREWVSATGAWVAIPFAALAIVVTVMQERRALKLKLSELPDLARVFISELDEIRTVASILAAEVRQLVTASEWSEGRKSLHQHLNVLKEQLYSEVILEAEKKFPPIMQPTSLARVKMALAYAINAVDNVKFEATPTGLRFADTSGKENAVKAIAYVVEQSYGYAVGSQQNAEELVRRLAAVW